MKVVSREGIAIEWDQGRDLLLIDGVEMSPEVLRTFIRPDPRLLFRFRREGYTVYVNQEGA
jgi:hypothetical protein